MAALGRMSGRDQANQEKGRSMDADISRRQSISCHITSKLTDYKEYISLPILLRLDLDQLLHQAILETWLSLNPSGKIHKKSAKILGIDFEFHDTKSTLHRINNGYAMSAAKSQILFPNEFRYIFESSIILCVDA